MQPIINSNRYEDEDLICTVYTNPMDFQSECVKVIQDENNTKMIACKDIPKDTILCASMPLTIITYKNEFPNQLCQKWSSILKNHFKECYDFLSGDYLCPRRMEKDYIETEQSMINLIEETKKSKVEIKDVKELDDLMKIMDEMLKSMTLKRFRYITKAVEEKLAINRFMMMEKSFGIYKLVSLCNHSCIPNSFFKVNQSDRSIRIKSNRSIKIGEEITFIYNSLICDDKEIRKKDLRDNYFFDCNCKACEEGSIIFPSLWFTYSKTIFC